MFAATGPVLLRVPVRPRDPVPRGPGAGPGDEREMLLAGLRELARDAVLREAVAVSSRSLAAAWRVALRPGADTPVRELWRVTLAVTKYALRAGSRGTPFGLLAGVALARLGPGAAAWLGRGHRTLTRPDRQWLRAALAQARPDLLRVLRLSADAGWARVGDLAVLPSGASVPLTPAVAAALERAAAPIAGERLLGELARACRGVPPAELAALVCRLVELGFLLTDLEPTPACPDPAEHVAGRAGRAPATPWAARFGEIRDRVARYDGLPPGAGEESLAAVYEPMLAIGEADRLVHVDLAVDAEVELPHAVADEAAAVAAALWRMSPPAAGGHRLRAYHRRFLERYGPDRLVPVPELLSPDRGLGPPPPVGRRTRDGDPERAAVLGRLAAGAIRRGSREVVLDRGDVAALSSDAGPGGVPASMELHARLLAASVGALVAGEFRLVLAPDVGTNRAGISFARFAALLEKEHRWPTAGGIEATLVYRPLDGRAENVAAAPRWLPHRIPVGVPPQPRHAGELPLHRLAVGATAGRLYLVRAADGEPVTPVAFDLLDPDRTAPPAVRLLRELAREGVRPIRPWSWGPLAHLPYLPRVRLGRSVLASATWRLAGTPLPVAARDASPGGWRAAVSRWREEAEVPGEVLLADGDRRLPLRLDDEVHLRILRQELRRGAPALVELPGGEDYEDAWLGGAAGVHACEVVIPLLRQPPAPAAAPVPRSARARTEERVAQPGGEWLHAKVYAHADRHDAILRGPVRDLVGRLERAVPLDRWFLVRYADPEPHLRLRFRAPADPLWSRGLPVLHAWMAGLVGANLAGRLAVDGYDPEVERYGGPEAIEAAERAFQADSGTALDILATGDVTDEVAAASVADLLLAFGDADDLLRRLGGAGTAPAARAAYRRSRARMRELTAPGRVDGRAEALGAYRECLLALGTSAAKLDGIALSLAHLHVNRLLGIAPERERAVLGLARNAVADRAARARFTPDPPAQPPAAPPSGPSR